MDWFSLSDNVFVLDFYKQHIFFVGGGGGRGERGNGKCFHSLNPDINMLTQLLPVLLT